jgi:hypothetical protein
LGRIEKEGLFLVAPLFVESDLVNGRIYYVPQIEMLVTLSLSLDELRAIHSVKCELTN